MRQATAIATKPSEQPAPGQPLRAVPRPPPSPEPRAARSVRPDAFRLYSMLLIVFAHSAGQATPSRLEAVSNLLAHLVPRFTMGFFFILSGYFVGAKIAADASPLAAAARYARRLAGVFLFWSVLYGLAGHPAVRGAVRHLLRGPRPGAAAEAWVVVDGWPAAVRLALEGTAEHLWFLPSLFLTILLFGVLPARRRLASCLVLGVALYVAGLVLGPYARSAAGLSLPIDSRDGVFFSVLFFGMGAALRLHPTRVDRRVAFAMALGGLVLFVAESAYVCLRFDVSPWKLDFLVSSVPFSLGVALLALQGPTTRLDRVAARYGGCVLGIYVMHPFFLDALASLGAGRGPYVLSRLVVPVVVFAASLVVTSRLAATPLRRLVA